MKNKEIGLRVKAKRTAKGWSQGELGKRAGLSQPTISDLERGKSLTSRYLLAIAQALGCSPVELGADGDIPAPIEADELFRMLSSQAKKSLTPLLRELVAGQGESKH